MIAPTSSREQNSLSGNDGVEKTTRIVACCSSCEHVAVGSKCVAVGSKCELVHNLAHIVVLGNRVFDKDSCCNKVLDYNIVALGVDSILVLEHNKLELDVHNKHWQQVLERSSLKRLVQGQHIQERLRLEHSMLVR